MYIKSCPVHCEKIEGNKQWCGEHAPHWKLRLIFSVGHATCSAGRRWFSFFVESHAHHVGIVELIRTCIIVEIFHNINRLNHTTMTAIVFTMILCVATIETYSPRMSAGIGSPEPGFAFAPFTNIEIKVHACCFEGVTHFFVTFLGRFHIVGCNREIYLSGS